MRGLGLTNLLGLDACANLIRVDLPYIVDLVSFDTMVNKGYFLIREIPLIHVYIEKFHQRIREPYLYPMDRTLQRNYS